MKKILMHILVVLMLFSLLAVLPVTAAINGKIAFESDRELNSRLYLMNPDGSEVKLLFGLYDTYNGNPEWSPDGKKIAFTFGPIEEPMIIYTINADGFDLNHFASTEGGRYPTWSPDGKNIAYSKIIAGESEEIYILYADGSVKRITFEGGWDPAWSPDGKKIAFTSDRDGYPQIYTMNPEGSQVIRLTGRVHTPHGSGERAAWSPNSKKIAYYATQNPDGLDGIYIMNADGSDQTRLPIVKDPDNPTWGNPDNPTWSPDGTKIAFDYNIDGHREIYSIKVDGTEQTRLTTSASNNYQPSWGPKIPSISVTSPNGGEIWIKGTTHQIKWSFTDNPGKAVKIELIRESHKGKPKITLIANNVPIGNFGKGSYLWTIPTSHITGTTYKVRIESRNYHTINDESNEYFSIISGAP